MFEPKSQHGGIVHHALPVAASPTAHIYYSVAEPPRPENTIAVRYTPSVCASRHGGLKSKRSDTVYAATARMALNFQSVL